VTSFNQHIEKDFIMIFKLVSFIIHAIVILALLYIFVTLLAAYLYPPTAIIYSS